MKHYMLTREEMQKSLFNAQDFTSEATESDLSFSVLQSKATNRFILYFMQILQFAFEINLISEAERNAIADMLVVTTDNCYNSNTVMVTNYLYATTLWLRSMSNWDAWLKLSTLETPKNVERFLTCATSFLNSKLNSISDTLEECKPKVLALKEKNISNTYSSLEKYISQTRKFEINFKEMHNSPPVVPYEFLFTIEGSNWLEYLENYTNAFSVEISLLSKMNAKSIFKGKKQEIKNFTEGNTGKTLDLQVSLDKQLANLKERYEQRISDSLKAQQEMQDAIHELQKKFALEHPEISEEDLEDEFDDYFFSLPDDFLGITYEDTNEIEKWYKEEKNRIQKALHETEKQLDKEHEKKQDIINLAENNLQALIKEFAIFSLAKKQVIVYPISLEERYEILAKLPLDKAIEEFITCSGLEFSDSEFEYLTKEFNM